MPHPKRRQSKSKRDKRRANYKATLPQLFTCSTTQQMHLSHRAHWYEDKLYYRGRVVLEKKPLNEDA